MGGRVLEGQGRVEECSGGGIGNERCQATSGRIFCQNGVKKKVEEHKRQEERGERTTKIIVDNAANPWQQRQTMTVDQSVAIVMVVLAYQQTSTIDGCVYE